MPEPSEPAQPGIAWQESLARSKAQIASGESVPLLPILDRLVALGEQGMATGVDDSFDIDAFVEEVRASA